MPSFPITRIKICCISSLEEAQQAIACGASALGLVGDMPSGPGVIDDALIQTIARSVPPSVATFLLTSETTALDIIAHSKRTHTQVIQMVDYVEPNQYPLIRQALPHIKLVQVVHVIDQESVEEALEAASGVDALLLDSGNPHLKIKELGGTGRTHDWTLSRSIRDQVKVPVFLAGGLNPTNVQQAIEAVHPFGVDVCSGVRSQGHLDVEKVQAFVASASYIKSSLTQ